MLKILLVALVCALFVASLCNALRLISIGRAHTGLPYLLVGVSGIFSSLLIGLPLVFGVSG